jgi:hypothetical protein
MKSYVLHHGVLSAFELEDTPAAPREAAVTAGRASGEPISNNMCLALLPQNRSRDIHPCGLRSLANER